MHQLVSWAVIVRVANTRSLYNNAMNRSGAAFFCWAWSFVGYLMLLTDTQIDA